jgi:hypothetical protein
MSTNSDKLAHIPVGSKLIVNGQAARRVSGSTYILNGQQGLGEQVFSDKDVIGYPKATPAATLPVTPTPVATAPAPTPVNAPPAVAPKVNATQVQGSTMAAFEKKVEEAATAAKAAATTVVKTVEKTVDIVEQKLEEVAKAAAAKVEEASKEVDADVAKDGAHSLSVATIEAEKVYRDAAADLDAAEAAIEQEAKKEESAGSPPSA